MTDHPANGERVIMTAKLIVEMLDFLGPEITKMLVQPFKAPTPGITKIMFYERKLSIMMDFHFPWESRKVCASAITDFQNAYEKLSVFEREAIKKDLIAMGY